ncbi:MAG: M15 family metallopeptidase [Ilumatobacteraceae bacterium]|nr:M15 family metallopeptidase [Ilumatobacteraceae bacterium]
MIRSLLITAVVLGSTVVATAATPAAQALDDTPWALPSTPERCTQDEADSGDVAHCLIAFYHDPAETGWGQPPAPGVGEGWSWNGYRYNGSEALEQWEAERITDNSEPVATLAAGRLETHVEAQVLFEGFLRDIAANGYRVRDASGYGFRCTSGNGGWSCPSGDPGDLSNHAWGLAIDMNAGTNPIRSYSRQDGVTACQTPMVTDLPKWVIETGEKWGLYWGGYGWNSGCADTDTERDNVYRDPPHFEFRGTVEQARAIAEFNLRNDPRSSCFLVIDDDGEEQEVCNRSGRPEADWRLPIDTGAPEGATAVMVNLTATEAAGPGFLTTEDCEARSGDRTTSALTFAAGDSRAVMAVVPVDEAGRFCVYRSTDVHSIVDVLGSIGADGEPLWFEPSSPTRLTDTRTDGSCQPLQECVTGPVPDGSVHAVPTEDDRPRIANLAVVDGSGPGFLQAGACDGIGDGATFSNLNYLDDAARSNLALIAGSDFGSCVYALTEAHVLVDELGALDPETGYGWALDQPRRVLDTRECTDTWCDDRPEAHTVIEVDLGTEAPGAAIAITATETAAPGFVTVGSCDDFDDVDNIPTSNLNHLEGQTATNLALVDLDEGRMCIYTLAAAQLIIDVQAELTEEHDAGLTPTAPERVHDSRDD